MFGELKECSWYNSIAHILAIPQDHREINIKYGMYNDLSDQKFHNLVKHITHCGVGGVGSGVAGIRHSS